jgi:hypothetical protein
MSKVYTKEELAASVGKEMLIAVHGEVYDVTKFHTKHPGEGMRGIYLADFCGNSSALAFAPSHCSVSLIQRRNQKTQGKNVTSEFERYHGGDEPFDMLARAKDGDRDDGIIHRGSLN